MMTTASCILLLVGDHGACVGQVQLEAHLGDSGPGRTRRPLSFGSRKMT